MTEVYVTGYGIVSALGTGSGATLDALRANRSGVEPVSVLETAHRDLPVGEVKQTNADLSQRLGLGAPHNRLRTVLLGITAAREAVAHAGLTEGQLRECAFVNGTTVGGMDLTEQYFAEVAGCERADKDAVTAVSYNDCGCITDMIAGDLGRFKMVTTTSTACSSAANAVMMGANLIKAGAVGMAVVGGSEALTRFHLNGFNTLMILDRERCRPFEDDRAGINLGEGAAYLVIESAESVRQRGAKPIARLSGYANACDAYHQTATSDNGEGPCRAMSEALQMAGLQPSDISYINAHGTGTPNNDTTELTAMHRIWGDELPPFSSTKSLTGHTTSASGSIESVICLLAMQQGFLPGGGQTAQVGLRHVVNNSFGFGGNDTTLIFSQI